VVRRLLILISVIAASLVAAVLLLLPPAAARSPQPEWKYSWPVVKGAYHIHSTRSDGTGTIDDIAAAASRTGLQFIIVTDHGDGTRTPEPPSYRSGVLCIDGVEVSTSNGHYVALNVPKTPFRLAGQARDVIDDVARFGGFGIAAHPTSLKPELGWQDWDAPFGGIEWLNADSEWRDESPLSLARALFTYPFRSAEALTSLLDRPEEALARWDRLARQRHVTGLAAADAHARLGVEQPGGEYGDGFAARIPSYESSFRAFVNHVILDGPLSGDAASDSQSVLASIHTGRVFSSIEGLASLGAFEMTALSAGMSARVGEYIDSAHPVELDAVIAAPAGTTMVVLRDGLPIYDTAQSKLRIDVGTVPATYRVEARLPDALQSESIPWLVSNPIYVNLRAAHTTPREHGNAEAVRGREEAPAATQRTAVATQSWHAESAPGSESALSPGTLADGTPALHWRVRLAEGRPFSQFAAIWFPADQGIAAHERLQLRASADRPMRLWAQLRGPGANGREQRWAKSFYLGPEQSTIDLKFAEFRGLDPPSADPPPMDNVDSLLLVVDTLNTLPGTAATISIVDLWLMK
jgi:hypothetical protein